MDSRRGLEMWGPVGRCVFLNWPRGSWQYDVICGAIIAGLFIFPNPEPQHLDVDGVLAAIETADAGLDSFTADMVSIEKDVLFGDEMVESGTIAFLKPAYFRREVDDPAPSIYVVAEDEITMYLPRIKQAQVMSIDSPAGEEEGFIFPGMSSSAELKTAYEVSLDGTRFSATDGARLYVLKLVPKAGTEAAKRWKTITLEVAEGEWQPARRIVLLEHSENTVTVELSNVVRNPELNPDDFELELPDDVEIVKRQTVIPNPP